MYKILPAGRGVGGGGGGGLWPAQGLFQHICISLDVNFNEPLTNDVVSFEQLGPIICIFVSGHMSQ